MGSFREIDLFSDADTVRTTHLLLHRMVPPTRLTYKCVDTLFGGLLLAQTVDGLSWSAFFDDKDHALHVMQSAFAGTTFSEGTGMWMQAAQRIIRDPLSARDSLCLNVTGSQFRLAVLRQLLDTPFGALTTYGSIATRLGDPKSSRAVGGAVGANPIAFFIPCHRVVNADGTAGHFRWGAARKKAMIAFEAENAGQELL